MKKDYWKRYFEEATKRFAKDESEDIIVDLLNEIKNDINAYLDKPLLGRDKKCCEEAYVDCFGEHGQG